MKNLMLLGLTFLIITSCQSQEKQHQQKSSNTQSTWDNSYGGVDKSYDTNLLNLREVIAPRFQTLEFKDKETGKTMTYNLYVPENYDKSKSYPLVQFIADASTVGKGAKAPLMQGYGGIIWATNESQNANPCFVLVPAFAGPNWATNDKGEVSDEVGISFRLLNQVVSDYNIDKNRIYTTGQSMGGMISFYLNATYPDFFAASIFVGSQWDIKVLKPLLKDKFFYIVSAGDERASAGMKNVGNLLTENSVKYGSIEFSAQLPQAEQNEKINNLIAEGYPINFVQFTPKTVTPKNTSERGAPEHMYSFDYAYQLKPVREWLFKQKK
ncbi:MAG: pyrroline-5-carboxylate reductase [Cytophagia bacterium]|nr:pyrroline-5-carboxylate reductase [Cytophagia bacterium]